MTEQRQISPEAVAMREAIKARRAEQDALILQDDILQLNEQIRQLIAELEHYRSKEVSDDNAA